MNIQIGENQSRLPNADEEWAEFRRREKIEYDRQIELNRQVELSWKKQDEINNPKSKPKNKELTVGQMFILGLFIYNYDDNEIRREL